jgi:hypothetical protein
VSNESRVELCNGHSEAALPDKSKEKEEESGGNIMTVWERYKEFEEYSYFDRAISVREFIREWEARLDRAVQAGCHYSDAVLAFKLLEQANLEKAELELGTFRNKLVQCTGKVPYRYVMKGF